MSAKSSSTNWTARWPPSRKVWETQLVTDVIRNTLRRRRGKWRELAADIRAADKRAGRRRSRITYRWITGFAAHQNKEPSFSRVEELAHHMGYGITISVWPIIK